MSDLTLHDCLQKGIVPWTTINPYKSEEWEESQRIPDDLRLMVNHALEHQVDLSLWFDGIRDNTHDAEYLLDKVVPEALSNWQLNSRYRTPNEWLNQFKFFLDTPCFEYFRKSESCDNFLTSIYVDIKNLHDNVLSTRWSVLMLEYQRLPQTLQLGHRQHMSND